MNEEQGIVINKEEAKYMLETILNSQVSVSLASVVNGVSLTPLVGGLIMKLQAGVNGEVPETKAEETTSDTSEEENAAPEANKEAENSENAEKAPETNENNENGNS